MQRFTFLLGLCALSLTSFILPAEKSFASEDSCKPLMVMYCTTCHNTERICNALGKKDEQAWTTTLKKMGEYGDIDKSTQNQVLQCLKDKKAGNGLVCK